MLRVVLGLAALAVCTTLVLAQNLDAIKQRQDAMDTMAKPGIQVFKMSKGEVPFDLATVQATLKTYQEQAAKLKTLFPDDSKTGGDTDAQPKIWQARAEFEKAIVRYRYSQELGRRMTDEQAYRPNIPRWRKVAATATRVPMALRQPLRELERPPSRISERRLHGCAAHSCARDAPLHIELCRFVVFGLAVFYFATSHWD